MRSGPFRASEDWHGQVTCLASPTLFRLTRGAREGQSGVGWRIQVMSCRKVTKRTSGFDSA
jgi:hypothetical protein